VPRSTRPGTYQVNATVTQGAQTRAITRSLVVTGKAATLNLGTRFGSRLDRRGRSAVTISCPATADGGCVGSVTLNTASKVAVPAAKARRRVLRLGKARFRLKAGTKGTLRIKVGRKGRKLLRAKGKLRVKAAIAVRGQGTANRRYTLKVAKKKR
jgi:ferric-dicitrate binding protein FerR (iron transport regulator)